MIRFLYFIAAFIFFSLCAYTSPIYITNLSSQTNALPGCAKAGDFPALEKGMFIADNEHVAAIDILDGEILIDAYLPPMQTAGMTPTKAKKYFPDWGDEGGVNLIRYPGNINFRVDNTGIALEDNYVLLCTQARWWRKKYEGYAVIQLARRGAANLLIDCFSSGNARITVSDKVEFKVVNRPLIKKRNENLLARNVENGDILEGPFDSLYLNETAVFVPRNADRWIYDHGMLRPATTNKTVAYLIRCFDVDAWDQAVDSAVMPLIGKPAQSNVIYHTDHFTAEVSGSSPGQAIWKWKNNDGRSLGSWKFSTLHGAPVGSCTTRPHESDGFQIIDTSGRGIYVDGSLLYGGRLTSAQTDQCTLSDLDRDNDPDIVSLPGGKKIVDVCDSQAFIHWLNVDASNPCKWSLPHSASIAMHANNFYTQQPSPSGTSESLSIHPPNIPVSMSLCKNSENTVSIILNQRAKKDSPPTALQVVLRTKSQPPQRPCRYTDPAGNKIQLSSSLLPSTWDGNAMNSQKLFYRFVSELEIATVTTVFTSPTSDSSQPETDWDQSGKALQIYTEPFTGGIHIYGMPRECTTNIHASGGFFTARSIIRAFDNHQDGRLDTFELDMDADGKTDRMIQYNHRKEILRVSQGSHITFFPYNTEYSTCILAPENLGRIAEMFTEKETVLPLIETLFLSDSGIPIHWSYGRERLMHVNGMYEKRSEFYLIFEPEKENPDQSHTSSYTSTNQPVQLFELTLTPRHKTFTIRSPGGTIKIPRHTHDRQILINGDRIKRETRTMFDVIVLDAGTHTIELIDEDITHEL